MKPDIEALLHQMIPPPEVLRTTIGSVVISTTYSENSDVHYNTKVYFNSYGCCDRLAESLCEALENHAQLQDAITKRLSTLIINLTKES